MSDALPLRSYQLSDNLAADSGAVFLTGTLGLTQNAKDVAIAVGTAATFVAAFAWGRMSDRIGNRRSLMGTLLTWSAGILLVAFFVSSSALSHYKAQSRSKRDAARFFDKTGQRDIGQALAWHEDVHV